MCTVFWAHYTYKLTNKELKYSRDNLTFLISGELEIDSDIDPEVFESKIDCIDNYGEILVSGRLYGIVQTRLRTRKGDLINNDKKEDDGEENILANVGYLKL